MPILTGANGGNRGHSAVLKGRNRIAQGQDAEAAATMGSAPKNPVHPERKGGGNIGQELIPPARSAT